MLTCEAQTDSDPADELPIEEDPPAESVWDAAVLIDGFSFAPVSAPDAAADDSASSGLLPQMPAHAEVPPPIAAAGLSRPDRRGFWISVLTAVVVHAALVGIGIYAWRHFNDKPATWRTEFGNGASPGDPSAESGEGLGGAQNFTMPPLPAHEPDSAAKAKPMMPTESTSLDSVPDSFRVASDFRQAERAEPIPPIGVGATQEMNLAVPARRKAKNVLPPVSETASRTAPATPDQPAAISGAALSAPGPAVAGAAPTGPPHVNIRAAYGGGGTGGSPDGRDAPGLPRPEYPVESRRRGEEGRVLIEAEILPDGTVGELRVIRDNGFPRLAAAALDAVRRGRFTPATCDGQAVGDRLIIPFDFVLRNRR